MKISRERVVEIIDEEIEFFASNNAIKYAPGDTLLKVVKSRIQQLEDET